MANQAIQTTCHSAEDKRQSCGTSKFLIEQMGEIHEFLEIYKEEEYGKALPIMFPSTFKIRRLLIDSKAVKKITLPLFLINVKP